MWSLLERLQTAGMSEPSVYFSLKTVITEANMKTLTERCAV